MITKSIERAQRKVEENNFGIRKRLLEYDDVMNKQRTVIYTKRHHALFGKRLALDIDNAFYSVAKGLINNFKAINDFEGFKLAVIVNFGIDTSINIEELNKANDNSLTEKLYSEAINNYQRKKQEIALKSVPVFKNIRLHQGNNIENVVVPFSDGKKTLQVLASMQKTLDSEGVELLDSLERNLALALIDEAWKEHLRAMDDLKQSVQTATYEQKDPLVIYKMEAYNLFENMNAEVNKNIVEFLCHCGIPSDEEGQQLKEGRQQKTDLSKTSNNKDDIDSRGDSYGANENDYYDPSANVKQQPVIAAPKIGRNDLCPCGSGKKYKACHGKDA
ncbi:MAG: SEC-C domain-containing protein [Chitinophagaceae bacterium]|nr:SEC-C domain-containing protein [Chitinophagaceae bacterium]